MIHSNSCTYFRGNSYAEYKAKRNSFSSVVYLGSIRYQVEQGKLLHVSSDLIPGLGRWRWRQAIKSHHDVRQSHAFTLVM